MKRGPDEEVLMMRDVERVGAHARLHDGTTARRRGRPMAATPDLVADMPMHRSDGDTTSVRLVRGMASAGRLLGPGPMRRPERRGRRKIEHASMD